MTMYQMLLSGDFRHWGAIHQRQFERKIAYCGAIGIEIEAYGKVNRNQWKRLEKYGIESSYIGWENQVEFIKLFLLGHRNPKRFRKEVFQTVQQIASTGCNTLGGLHLNIQYNNSKIDNLYGDNRIIYVITDRHPDIEDAHLKDGWRNSCRIEYKHGSGFLEPVDLLAQLILYIQMMRLGQTKEYLSEIETIISATPKELLSIDLYKSQVILQHSFTEFR